jgi:hypothetical protein
MNCATNQRKASFTTTATLDLIQDYQKKKDIEHIRKDMIPSPHCIKICWKEVHPYQTHLAYSPHDWQYMFPGPLHHNCKM